MSLPAPSSNDLSQQTNKITDDLTTTTTNTTTTSPSSSSDSIIYPVTIIGGGIAGVTAARTLLDNGISPIRLLEATSRLGGRARRHHLRSSSDTTTTASSVVVIEQGANWIHGPSDANPIYRVARKKGLTGIVDSETNRGGGDEETTTNDNLRQLRARDVTTGRDVSDDFHSSLRRFERGLRRADEEEEEDDDDATTDETMRESLALHGWTPLTPIDHLAEWFGCDYDYAARLEELSARHNLGGEYTWEDFGGGNFMVTDERGFGEVLVSGILSGDDDDDDDDAAAAVAEMGGATEEAPAVVPFVPPSGLDVRFDAVVTRIESCRNDENNDVLHVHLENGDIIPSHRVICTVSIGVLRSPLISFQPPLSKPKRDAINHVPMACYAKVYLYWKLPWLPSPKDEDDDDNWQHMFLHHSTTNNDSSKNRWRMVTKCHPPKGKGQILLLTLVGDEGRALESQSSPQTHHVDNDTLSEILSVLKSTFPEHATTIPSPDDHFVSRWSADKFFRGAYSLLPPGCPWDVEDELRRSEMDGRLYFAGEACCPKYSGFLHGAYNSGRETAERVVMERSRSDEG